MKNLLTRWTIALVVAFLLMTPHLRMFANEPNRYFGFWGYSDPWAIVIVLAGIASIFFMLYEAARWTRSRWVVQCAHAAFVLVTCLAVFSVLRSGGANLAGVWRTICLYSAGGAAVLGLAGATACLLRRRRIVRIFRAGCLIAAPVVPIVLLQLFSYPQFSVADESLLDGSGLADPAKGTADAPDVFVFIFDGCSYDRLLNDRDVRRATPNVARLLACSTSYTNAHSVYPETFRSLPSILYGVDEEYTLEDGGLYFVGDDGSHHPVGDRRHLFDDMRERGYHTHMVGWSHPYRRMLGASVDYCYAHAFAEGNRNDHNLVGNVLRHLRHGGLALANAVPLPEPLQWRVNAWTGKGDETAFAAHQAQAIHEKTLSIVRRSPRPTCAVFHYPVPHPPYVFGRSGPDPELLDRYPLDFNETHNGLRRPDSMHHVQRYRGNLDYMDTLLGDILDELERSNRFENSLIVLTADHGWRVDPLHDDLCREHGMALGMIRTLDPAPAALTHVPLIIKRPGQPSAARNDTPFSLANLRRLIADSKRRHIAKVRPPT